MNIDWWFITIIATFVCATVAYAFRGGKVPFEAALWISFFILIMKGCGK
jgi:hypothetical protein